MVDTLLKIPKFDYANCIMQTCCLRTDQCRRQILAAAVTGCLRICVQIALCLLLGTGLHFRPSGEVQEAVARALCLDFIETRRRRVLFKRCLLAGKRWQSKKRRFAYCISCFVGVAIVCITSHELHAVLCGCCQRYFRSTKMKEWYRPNSNIFFSY